MTPEYQEQADFITEALFEKMADGWDNKLRDSHDAPIRFLTLREGVQGRGRSRMDR